MFKTFDQFELKSLYEIKDLIKQNPVYYTIINKITKEIEQPVTLCYNMNELLYYQVIEVEKE